MSYPNYARPEEPLVSKNAFRTRSYQPQEIPSFAEAREYIPVPVLPDHMAWMEMYWRAWEIAWNNLRRPQPAGGFIANYIDAACNGHMLVWHSAFTVQFGLYARHAFDFMGTLDNFYSKQHDDGFICRDIETENGRDCYYPFDPDGTGPNILAWAEWRYFRVTGDSSRLSNAFWPLVAYHRWCRANRTWQNGLYWATGLSSGMDNQPRVPDSRHHHRHWSWVDASMQAALNCLTLGKMATMLKEEELALELAQERSTLLRLINEQMWNSEANFYQDIDAEGHFSRVKSIGAYWGLLDKELIPENRRAAFVKQLRENWAFKLAHRIPSQSADSEGYNAQTGHYWRGAVWAPTNFMVLKGLRVVRQNKLAHDIAVNHLKNVCEVYQHTNTFWENYAPETAAAGDPAQSDFVGWTGLSPITILLEDVIGLRTDWPQRRVIWDRRLDIEGKYGILNYSLGPDGTLDILGDRETVTITTDTPFTLTIQDATQSLQAAISSGTTEIDLT